MNLTTKTIRELAVLMHEAEEGDDDIGVMEVDDEIRRRDKLVPRVDLPWSGTSYQPTPTRQHFTSLYMATWIERQNI